MSRWKYNGYEVSDKPPNLKMFGFIYQINYTNGKSYIGKKQFHSETTQEVLKTGIPRLNSKRITKRVKMTNEDLENRTKAQVAKKVRFKMVEKELVIKENDWRRYVGSSKDTKGFVIESKVILEICYDKTNLTYCELKWMMRKDVLVDDSYVNSNMLGKFFVGKISNGI